MDLMIKKSPICVEDIEVGLGEVEQVRGNDTLTLNKLNASQLLGIMCFDTLDELVATNIQDIKTTVVYVTNNKAIYHYKEQQWIKANLNMEIIKSSTELATVSEDTLAVFNLADQLVYYKNNNIWSANGTNVCVVQKESDLYSLPSGVNVSFVIDTNMIYTYKLGTWSTQISTQNSSPILIVDTIDDLPKLSTITTCLVNDRKTGGMFCYDDTLPEVGGDGGITIGKWRRLHGGIVNVLWFGVDNTGVTDCSTLLTAAFQHQNILVPPGDYLIKSPIEVNNDISIQSIGAKFILEEVGSLVFKGNKSIEASINDIAAGATSYQLNNVNLFKEGKYCYLKGTGSISNYSNIQPAQYFRMVSLTGITVTLSGVVTEDLVNPTVSIYDGLSVKLSGIDIVSTSTVSAITLENVTDSVLSNFNLHSSSQVALTITNSTGINLNNTVIFTKSDSATDAIVVKDSSNIIVENNIITSGNAGIKYSGLVTVSGIYKSIITATNPLYTSDNSVSLVVKDTELNGTPKVGGLNLLLDNCNITGDFFDFDKLSGGSIVIKDSTFTGISTNISDTYMRVSNTKIFGDNYNLIKPCYYNITNNIFNGGNVYQGFIEIIGRQAKLNSAGTELSSIVIIDKLYTTLSQPPISAFGRFALVKLSNITHKAQQYIDIQSLYTANNRVIKTLATNVVQLDKFELEDTTTEAIQLKANIDTKITSPDLVIGATIPIGAVDIFFTDTNITKTDTGSKVVLTATKLVTSTIYKRMKGTIPIRYPGA